MDLHGHFAFHLSSLSFKLLKVLGYFSAKFSIYDGGTNVHSPSRARISNSFSRCFLIIEGLKYQQRKYSPSTRALLPPLLKNLRKAVLNFPFKKSDVSQRQNLGNRTRGMMTAGLRNNGNDRNNFFN